MVFEYLFGAKDVEGHPLLMFAAGFTYTILSVPLALFFHPSAASILSVSLATIAAIPIILKIIEFESDMLDLYPNSVLSREARIITLYIWFFIGEIAGFTTAFLLLSPEELALATEFQAMDLKYVDALRTSITGRAVAPDVFSIIFSNNLRVYALGIILSFIYGTGGILILTWNASVVATVLANTVIESRSLLKGFLHFLGILPHGIIEYSAYTIGGFTGGLISLILLQKGWNRRLMFDAAILILSGILLLYIGAAVESVILLTSP